MFVLTWITNLILGGFITKLKKMPLINEFIKGIFYYNLSRKD